MNLTDEDVFFALNDYVEATDNYFKNNIGFCTDLGMEANHFYEDYPAEDILIIAFKLAISTDTADKIIFAWNNYDLSDFLFRNPIAATLEALSFDGVYDQVLEIVKERKAKEEKEKISGLVTAPFESQEKKRI
jgi:hypothetical protein